jgi:hypothetical protein
MGRRSRQRPVDLSVEKAEGFEPGPMLFRRPCSGRWMACELGLSFADTDRSCPPRTSGS